MRTLLAIGSIMALGLIAACSDDDRPNDVPRTIPPVSADGAVAAPVVKGVGPTIEVLAYDVSIG